MKNELSIVERQAFFAKHSILRGGQHTLLFFDRKIGTRVPIVTIKRQDDDLIKVVHNPDQINHATIIRKIKQSI